MFEVGFTEIILIFGIALLVLGPARLPKLAADVGRWAGRARSMARQLRTQLEQETQYDPLADIDTSLTPSSTTSSSNTIHVSEPSAPSDDTRASPAQLAADVPPPAGAPVVAQGSSPASPNTALDAIAPADTTVADEPKHG